MRHFISFLALVFLILFVAMMNRHDGQQNQDSKSTLRIFSSNSFASQWGPGPKLKEIFEASCNCYVQFVEGADAGVILQRLKIEAEGLGADLVLGLDQFDLQKALIEFRWNQLNYSNLNLDPNIREVLANNFFVPYDWGVLSFMRRKNSTVEVLSLDDLLKPELAKKVLIQDPRTSSPGLQFLYWVVKTKGEEAGFRYMDQLLQQVHSVTPSWSLSIGLYNKKQADLVFSYITSPIYYEVEENNFENEIIEFKEALPVQLEFVGIPELCRNCQLAEKFVNFILSAEGQKIIMEKNYMFPALGGVRENTKFDIAKNYKKLMKVDIPSDVEVDRLLKRWANVRRGE